MLKIFVVFHKKIFDECYEEISQDILDRYFTFVAVNKDIPKKYTEGKYNVVNEWDLPVYNDQFQKKGYNENSVIYHVIANKMHEECKYIGFFQYDMNFTKKSINTILEGINKESNCFYLEAYNYGFCAKETWKEPPVMAYLTSHYEFFHNRKFSKSYKNIYPLYNSYIIPVETYEKVMRWVSFFYTRIASIVFETHFGNIGGLYERIMAFAIGEENLNMIKLDIKHDHDYKNSLSEVES
jgi:hypothetical protein